MVLALSGFWDLKKTALLKIRVNGTVRGSPKNAKIPYLWVHKPKIEVAGSAVVGSTVVGSTIVGSMVMGSAVVGSVVVKTA